MRPRALAVALGLPIPRMQPSESVAGEIAAFLRKQGVNARKRRGQEEVSMVLPTSWARVPDAPHVATTVEWVPDPQNIETAPDLDIWRKNDGGDE